MEGPSIVILKEEASKFVGQRVIESVGNTKALPPESLRTQRLRSLGSRGKNFFLEFDSETIKIHFMLFGSYRIDEPKADRSPRLHLEFERGAMYFYACSIKVVTDDWKQSYPAFSDVMAPEWDDKRALGEVEGRPDEFVGDVLLNQEVFTGVGNIMRNEILYRMSLHPETKIRNLDAYELRLLIREARLYALQFYVWKKAYVLRKNWLVYRKRQCPRCSTRISAGAMGRLGRRTHICPKCQTIRRKRASAKRLAAVRQRLRAAAREIATLQRKLGGPPMSARAEIDH